MLVLWFFHPAVKCLLLQSFIPRSRAKLKILQAPL